MIYYIHAYSPDAPLLHLCTARILELDPTARIVVANDPSNPIPASIFPKHAQIKSFPPKYPLGGNLNGKEMIEGMLDTFVRIMEFNHERHIIKMDCDAWLNNVDWLKEGYWRKDGALEPDYIGLERAEPLTAAGDCYRISLYAARAALKLLRARQWDAKMPLPEDRTILELVMRSRLPVMTLPYTDGKHCGMHASIPGKRESKAWVIHCGETTFEGNRAPRDFVLLRMRLMEAITKTKNV